ncbi:MAG: outer membrane beta-barrel protein [Pseudomonadota bacterium]
MAYFARWAATAIALPAVTLSQAAFAQSDEVSGIRAGSFTISPSVSVTTSFENNVFLEDVNEEESFRVIIGPEVSIQSDWNRHAVRLDAGVQANFFSNDSDDNFVGYFVDLSGELDVQRGIRITGGVGYTADSEARGAVDTPGNVAEPIDVQTISADLGAIVQFNFIRIQPFAGITSQDFDDAPIIGGGISNQDDRDRIELEAGLEVGYELRTGFEAFIRGSYNITDYDAAVDDTGVNRDSDGWRILGGVEVELTRLVEGRVGLGYSQRDFDDPALASTGGFAADVGVIWTPTRRLTIELAAARDIAETTIAGASSSTELRVLLGANYSVLRNLDARGAFEYANAEFDGSGRTDNTYQFTVGADWDLTRQLTLSPQYRFETRDSNVAGSDYDNHIISLEALYRF